MPQAIPAIVSWGASILTSVGVAKGAALLISQQLVNTAILTAASAGLRALSPKPDAPSLSDPGYQLRTRVNAREPRGVVYGETLVAGHLVFEKTSGTDRENLHRIYTIGDGGAYEGVQEIRFGDEVLTLDGSNNVTNPTRYDGYASIYTTLGSESQPAISQAVTDITEWTSNHRGRGVAHAYVKLVYDQDAWTSGVPDLFFLVRGRKVYDPRLDSTNGGSGTHRKDDATTWEWSQNPALWVLDYMRGVKMGGTLVAGLGLPDALIDWAAFADAADACDESVSVVGGGTIDRYTGGGGLVSSSDNPVAIIGSMVNTIAGEILPRSGYVALFAGEARTATVTLTDDDLAGPVNLKTAKSIRETVNSLQVGYRDPGEGHEMVDAPAYSDASWVTDDGETFPRTVGLPLVDDHRQAQRIGKIMASRIREPRTLTGTFKQKALQVREGDAFTWSSDRFPSGVTGKYICTNRNANADGTVDITARSEDDTKYSWDHTTEEQSRTSPGDIAEPVDTGTSIPNEQVAGLGDLAVLDNADWTANVSNRPTELTDNRVANGLDSTGAIKVAVPGAVKTASDILSRTGGGTYTGSLAATENTGALADKNTVAAGDIDSNAVTAAKIASGAVETAKLATSAVETDKIASNAVTNADSNSADVSQTGTGVVCNPHELVRETITLTSGSTVLVDYRFVLADLLSASTGIIGIQSVTGASLDFWITLVRDPDGTPVVLDKHLLRAAYATNTFTDYSFGTFIRTYEDTGHGGGSTTYALNFQNYTAGTTTGTNNGKIRYSEINAAVRLLEAKR